MKLFHLVKRAEPGLKPLPGVGVLLACLTGMAACDIIRQGEDVPKGTLFAVTANSVGSYWILHDLRTPSHAADPVHYPPLYYRFWSETGSKPPPGRLGLSLCPDPICQQSGSFSLQGNLLGESFGCTSWSTRGRLSSDDVFHLGSMVHYESYKKVADLPKNFADEGFSLPETSYQMTLKTILETQNDIPSGVAVYNSDLENVDYRVFFHFGMSGHLNILEILSSQSPAVADETILETLTDCRHYYSSYFVSENRGRGGGMTLFLYGVYSESLHGASPPDFPVEDFVDFYRTDPAEAGLTRSFNLVQDGQNLLISYFGDSGHYVQTLLEPFPSG